LNRKIIVEHEVIDVQHIEFAIMLFQAVALPNVDMLVPAAHAYALSRDFESTPSRPLKQSREVEYELAISAANVTPNYCFSISEKFFDCISRGLEALRRQRAVNVV
jgi:hypothetical protein